MFHAELDGKIMKEFCALRPKTYTYLMDDDTENKKAKRVKRCVIKRRLIFKNYKDSLFNNKTILQSQLRFKTDRQNVYTEKVNKIALSSMMIRDCKRLTELQHIHMEQMLLKYRKVKC